jgi:hypothetical protein
MRSWLSLGVLLLVVAALGIWVYVAPPPEKVDTIALSDLRPAEVKRIAFARGVAGADAKGDAVRSGIILERTAGTWRITAPFAARAEPFQMERLLGILEARASARFPARELAQYGLDAPAARLTIDEQAFSFGGVNQLTREQYVLTNDAVYAIPFSQRVALPADADALIARAPLGRDEYPVRFALPGFRMTLADGRWRLDPDPKETTADERTAWVDAWRNATAMRAARAPARSAASDIVIMLKDGTELAIDIVRSEPEIVLQRADEGIEYSFLTEAGKRLLEPPARKE